MRFLPVLILATALPLGAQSVVSEPIGFNKVTCLANSDTIVGVPLRKEGSRTTKLSGAPTGTGDAITLPVTATLTAGELTKHYVKFTSGAKSSRYYDVTANTIDSITIDANGDSLAGVVSNDSIIIAEFWTLDSLFPPSSATSDPLTTGHAIVASTSTLGTGRRTEVLLPNVAGTGTNLPAEGRYYIHGGIWKRGNSGNSNYGTMRLYPDTYFTISHPTTVTQPTVFKSVGEVDTNAMLIPLYTRESVAQDNYIAIPRPVALTLEQLNLRQYAGAFMPSTSTLGTGRRDQLLVFDNEFQLRNKTPSATYYVHNGIWKLHNGGNTDRGTVVIPAGAGFIIRKYQVAGQPTSFWNNTPTY